jgi:hypothetical protein
MWLMLSQRPPPSSTSKPAPSLSEDARTVIISSDDIAKIYQDAENAKKMELIFSIKKCLNGFLYSSTIPLTLENYSSTPQRYMNLKILH